MNDEMNELDYQRAIRDLPRDIQPGRDLWGGIAARIAEDDGLDRAAPAARPRVPWPAALAASVLLAFAAGLIAGRLGNQPPPVEVDPARGLELQAALQAGEREYHAALLALAGVGEEAGYIDEATALHVREAWSLLQRQEAEMLAALDAEPGNLQVAHALMDLRDRQLEFLRQLATLERSGFASIRETAVTTRRNT